MTKKELVEKLAAEGSGIDSFVYDADRDSLRELCYELWYALYGLSKKYAHECFTSNEIAWRAVCDNLSEELKERWTYGTGEWEEGE